MFWKKLGICLIIIFFFIWLGRKLSKPGVETKTILVSQKHLLVETAVTEAQKEKGLSDQETLCKDCGLLFIYNQQGIYPFWMKRMYFDIDIIWIAGDKIADITFGAKKPSPEDFNSPKEIHQSRLPIDKVLEVNAGWVEKNGIKVGDVVKY